MSRGAHWNRAGRRSGGDRPLRIPVGTPTGKQQPRLAIQCFEQRHSECTGRDTLMGGICDCKCHSLTKEV